MADRSGLSKSTIGRIWRNFGLKPHLTDTFKLSTDPLFVEKVVDIVGCITTRPSVQWCCAWTRNPRSRRWTARTGPADDAGHARRRTHDYLRRRHHPVRRIRRGHGPSSARSIVAIGPQSSRSSWPRWTRRSRRPRHPSDLRRLRTHKTPTIKPGWRHPRFHLHFTPTDSCWINQVERLVRVPDRPDATARSPQEPPGPGPTSAPGLLTGTRTRGPSSGPRPPTRSWNASPDIADEFQAQDTSGTALESNAQQPVVSPAPTLTVE